MQRQSEIAFDLLTTSEEIISSIETHGPEVAARLDERWTAMTPPPDDSTPQLDAPSPPDYLGNLLALRDGLSVSAGSLSRTDQVHVHNLAALIELRDERGKIFEIAYDKFSAMRRFLDELHGEDQAFVLAAMESPTARTPKKLLRQIDLSVAHLRTPNPKLSLVKVEGVTINTAEMAGELEGLADRLRAKQNEFQRARRVAQASRKEKQRRIAEHHDTNTWSARIVEGYYRLAGETELADRLRSAATRPGRPTEPDDNPTPDDTPPTDTPPVDSPPAEPPPGETDPEEATGEGLTLGLRANLRPAPSADPA